MINEKKIINLLNVLEQTMELSEQYITEQTIFAQSMSTIMQVQTVVNKELFFTPHFTTLCPNNMDESFLYDVQTRKSLLEGVFGWFQFVVDTIEGYKKEKTYIDSEWFCLCRYLQVSNGESLAEDWKLNYENLDDNSKKSIRDYYDLYDYFWGVIHPEENRYDLIVNRVNVWKEHENDFQWLYHRLADYRSKIMLCRVLRNWISFDKDDLKFTKEMCFEDYFDLDLLHPTQQEVMVDCGAFIGDSAMGYIASYKTYQKIYCYEATQNTFDELQHNMSEYENVVCKHLAVGKEHGKIFLSEDYDSSSIYGKAQQEVEMVSLDEDIKEPVSIIKMDIEGSEQNAILGAKSHILNDYPKLLICVYHGNKDIIEIPMLIESIRGDYDYYFRYNGNFTAPTEMVLFAIPKEKQ